MSLTAFASTRIWGMAFAAFLAVLAMSAGAAQADPCADSCRSQHNGCRMAAKLLYSARCDAQLQSCISQCFAAGRFSRVESSAIGGTCARPSTCAVLPKVGFRRKCTGPRGTSAVLASVGSVVLEDLSVADRNDR